MRLKHFIPTALMMLTAVYAQTLNPRYCYQIPIPIEDTVIHSEYYLCLGTQPLDYKNMIAYPAPVGSNDADDRMLIDLIRAVRSDDYSAYSNATEEPDSITRNSYSFYRAFMRFGDTLSILRCYKTGKLRMYLLQGSDEYPPLSVALLSNGALLRHHPNILNDPAIIALTEVAMTGIDDPEQKPRESIPAGMTTVSIEKADKIDLGEALQIAFKGKPVVYDTLSRMVLRESDAATINPLLKFFEGSLDLLKQSRLHDYLNLYTAESYKRIEGRLKSDQQKESYIEYCSSFSKVRYVLDADPAYVLFFASDPSTPSALEHIWVLKTGTGFRFANIQYRCFMDDLLKSMDIRKLFSSKP